MRNGEGSEADTDFLVDDGEVYTEVGGGAGECLSRVKRLQVRVQAKLQVHGRKAGEACVVDGLNFGVLGGRLVDVEVRLRSAD
jgi:hypothetical protein